MQEEYFGYGSIEKLSDILDRYNSKNIFLVTGKKSFSLSGSKEKLLPILRDRSYTHFNSFSANPSINEIYTGISIFKKKNYDLVITIGGGSAIDIGKAINVLAFQNDLPELVIKGKKRLKSQGLPLIAIPLTSGTGSEATGYSTIYINKTKYSLSDRNLIVPSVSIIDPSLTESMPKYLTAVTGLDALCQGIESYWSINSTEKSRKYANESVKLAYNSIERAVNCPDKDSRMKMARAANLSGKAINISKTTACHSISYPITSYFNVPHGHAVALTMPEIIEFNYNINKKDCNDKRGVDFVKKRLDEIIILLDSSDEKEAKYKINKLMLKIGVETKLNKLNISKKNAEIILKKGFKADRMSNNPRKIERKNLEEILKRIL
jgi:alcohol dehydrogenase class IV